MSLLRRGSLESVSLIESKQVQGQGTSRRATISESVQGIADIVARRSSSKKQHRSSAPARQHGKVGFLRKAWSKARWSLLGIKPPTTFEDDHEQPALQRGWDVARHLVHGTGHALEDSKRLMHKLRRIAESAHHQQKIQKQIMADLQEAFEASLMVPSDGMETAIGDIISDLYSIKMLDLSHVAENISNLLLEVSSSSEALKTLRTSLLAHLDLFEDFEKELGMNTATIEALVERVIGQATSLREQVLAARRASAGTECAKPRNGSSDGQKRRPSVHLPSVAETARYGALPEVAEHMPLEPPELESSQSLEATLPASGETDAMPRAVRKKRHAGTYDFGSNSERRMLFRKEEDQSQAQDEDSLRCAKDPVFARKMRWRKIQSSSRLIMPAMTRGNLDTSELSDTLQDGNDDASASEENCSESSAGMFDCDSEEDEKEVQKDCQEEMRRLLEEEQEEPALPPIENCSEQVTKLSLETSYLPQPSQRPLSRLHIKGRRLLGMPSVTCLGSKAHRHASMPLFPNHEQVSLLNRRKLVLSAAINAFPAITTITEKASEVVNPVSPRQGRKSEVLSPVSPSAKPAARSHTADVGDVQRDKARNAPSQPSKTGMPGSRLEAIPPPMAGMRSVGTSAPIPAGGHPTSANGTNSAPLPEMRRRKSGPDPNMERERPTLEAEEEEVEAARAALPGQRPRPSSPGSHSLNPARSSCLTAVRPPSKPPTGPNTCHGAGFEMVNPQMRRRRLFREKDEGIAQEQEVSCAAAPAQRPRTPEEVSRLRGA